MLKVNRVISTRELRENLFMQYEKNENINAICETRNLRSLGEYFRVIAELAHTYGICCNRWKPEEHNNYFPVNNEYFSFELLGGKFWILHVIEFEMRWKPQVDRNLSGSHVNFKQNYFSNESNTRRIFLVTVGMLVIYCRLVWSLISLSLSLACFHSLWDSNHCWMKWNNGIRVSEVYAWEEIVDNLLTLWIYGEKRKKK